MKIGLAAYEFKNNDVAFNLSQMERAMKAARGDADILCFGEAFLQGFDALSWQYDRDRHIAVSQDSDIMRRLCEMTVRYGVDLLFGYIEQEEERIYSSCAVIERGKLIHNYRRISKGWKEISVADEHYREGTHTGEFAYRGRRFIIALCGDLWDFPQRFQTEQILLWPIYVNFSLDAWSKYESEYAQQARLAAGQALMVNALSENPKSYGGAFHFVDGKCREKTAYGTQEILIVEV